ncbi:MAG TPA: tripartite tricarboxylate transporter substrate-binding protein [Alphaproteobacteria bacterium]
MPFSAGGSVDTTLRVIAPLLSTRLGQPIVVVNKPGGGATIGMSAVAKAAPDGLTLGVASFAFTANPTLIEKMGYDPLKDFEPVTLVARTPMLLIVNPKTPARTMREFIDWAKSQPPGALNYGSAGIGSSGHLMTEMFLSRAGLKMTHVPFTRGATQALARGDLDLQVTSLPTAAPWLQDAQVRAIGVTSLASDPAVPDVPPVSQTLPGFDIYEWAGLVAPAGTPRPIIDRVQREVALTIAEPDVTQRLAAVGSEPVGSTPEAFGAYLKEQTTLWADLIHQLGPIKATQ